MKPSTASSQPSGSSDPVASNQPMGSPAPGPGAPRCSGSGGAPLPLRGQIARFAVVGGSNAAIDFALFEVFILLFPTRDPDTLVIYNTIAVICALANSYRWNRSWTFRGSQAVGGRALWRERLLFSAQSVLNVVVNDLALAGVTVLLNRNQLLAHDATVANTIAKFVGVMVASTTSFVAMRTLVFKRGQSVGSPRAEPSA